MRALGMCQRKSRMTRMTVSDDLDEGGFQVVDGAEDELGPVVDGDDLDACRQSRLDLFDLGLDPVDDVEGVLALAHDDDAGNGLALCRRGRPRRAGGPARGRPRRHPGPGSACRFRSPPATMFSKSLEGPGVAASADHVLGPAEFDQPAAGLGVAAPDRLDDPVDGDAVSLEPVRDRRSPGTACSKPPTGATSATPGTAFR